MASMSCCTNPGIILLVIASLLAVTNASTVTVGGPQHWRYGFNYTDWAIKNSPFYIQDTLVFHYEPQHNVYLLPYLLSYMTCDFSQAELLANQTQGNGEGFAVVINQQRPSYFAPERALREWYDEVFHRASAAFDWLIERKEC